MYDQIRNNKIKSIVLILVFLVFIALIGLVFGMATGWGYFGFVIAIVLAGILSLTQYYHGDKLVLKVSRAKAVDKKEYPHLFNTVEGLSIAAGVPMPKLYVIDSRAPNAFATGRNPEHASVAVTTGLMEKLNRSELEGVIAHELSHVKNYDIRLATLVVALVGITVLISDFMFRGMLWGAFRGRRGKGSGIILLIALVLAILAPLIAILIRLAISRRREFLADASGAMLTRYPEGLASALEKLENDKEPLKGVNRATENLYIVNPLKGGFRGHFVKLFSTHPPMEERIKRLREM